MEQLELFPSLPTFRVSVRVNGEAQIYEVPAVDFDDARRIVANEFGDPNVWAMAYKTEPASAQPFTHTTAPERA